MKIEIDYREKSLIEVIQTLFANNTDIQTEAVNLEIGDVRLTHDQCEFLFERKAFADFAASIKDGRLKEQKTRILSQLKPPQVSYIIEGAPDINYLKYSGKSWNGLKGDTYIGSYLSTMYRDGIHVLFTKNIEDTALWITEFAFRIQKDPSKFTQQIGGEDYIDCMKIKKQKIENITPQRCYLLMLSQIPHVSTKIATEIEKFFPTMADLYAKLTPLPREERLKKLSAIDGIGKKKSELIIDFLFPTSI